MGWGPLNDLAPLVGHRDYEAFYNFNRFSHGLAVCNNVYIGLGNKNEYGGYDNNDETNLRLENTSHRKAEDIDRC